MQDDPENKKTEETEKETEGKLSGFNQFIVGELETIGGVLTGDPLAQAEGEFNVEVGSVREELEETAKHESSERDSEAE
jgi:uncharacterized protein YjbJ (UPF0337 family)